MDTRIIGIDLAVKAAHKAIVLDQASNKFVSKLLRPIDVFSARAPPRAK